MIYLRPFLFAVPLVATLLATQRSADAIVLHFEDFNDATLGYSSTLTDPGTSDGDQSYFGRVGGTGGLIVGGAVSFTNTSGGYFGAMATAGAPNIGSGVVNWTGINIAGFNNLTFSGLFAEDDNALMGVEDWDPDSQLLVQTRIDGGAFTDIFELQSSSTTGPTAPSVDTDFDGEGDGAEINDTFTQFVANIAGMGNLLDLRITMVGLTEAGEDIAFDNIMISGDEDNMVATPEPGSLALLGTLAFGGLIVRRRRRKTSTDS